MEVKVASSTLFILSIHSLLFRHWLPFYPCWKSLWTGNFVQKLKHHPFWYLFFWGITAFFVTVFGVRLPCGCLPNLLDYNINLMNNHRFWLYYNNCLFFVPKLFIYVCGLCIPIYFLVLCLFMLCFVVVSQVSFTYIPDLFFWIESFE